MKTSTFYKSFAARGVMAVLVAVLTPLLWALPSEAMAQSGNVQRDVITIKNAKIGAADADGEFKTGALSAEHPGVYVIDVGDMSAKSEKDEDGNYLPQIITVTLSRPLGATAKRAATVKLGNMRFWGEGPEVTFEPGETEKTVEIPTSVEPSDSYEDESGEWHELITWSGNIPEIFTIRTTYADAEYDALLLNVNRTGADEPRQSTFATKLEVLQNTFGNDHANYSVTRWGEYILFRFFLATDVKVGADSRYVINARFADHTNLGPDDDDFGLAQTHEVELHPINAGSICSEAWYIYKPTPDEYLHSYSINLDFPAESGRGVEYPVLEVGPFEVANPAEDAVRYIFYSRSDLPEESANSLFGVYFEVDGLRPEFSNVSINKTAFKSGETMVITATMDNWKFVKRCQGGRFRSSFGVTLNGNESLESGRYTFDEQTGLVTYYVTAPTVAEQQTVWVDFGPACRIADGNTLLDKSVQNSPETSFAVTVAPEAVAPNPITEFDIPGLPADGSLIVLKKVTEYIGSFYYITRVDPKSYGLDPVYLPLDATNANQISYTVANSGDARAEIIYNGLDGISLNTGTAEGTFTLTASIGDEVKLTRTYTLMAKEGDTTDALAMPEARNHSNKYNVGTVFPLFQFELKNPDNRPVDDAFTVNYTHANGLTWTETYSFKALKSHATDRGTILYDLPFSFTEEHPDATDDSQIGETVITARVLIDVPTTEGPKQRIECISMLISDLKQISFGDYNEMTAYYNDVHPVTLSSEVMYLPRKGFTVGYEIPELGIKETYNNKSGEPVPEWLELTEDEYYCTANIVVHPTPDQSITQYNFFTLAQRSYSSGEVMLRELTSVANLTFAGREGHMIFRVNGEDVTGDLTFDSGTKEQEFSDFVKSTMGGFASYRGIYQEGLLFPAYGFFNLYDDLYGGAEVTLSCEGEVIQTLKGFNGQFSFLPPLDERTYNIEVYFPGYNERYNCSFVSHPLPNLYKILSDIDTSNTPFAFKDYAAVLRSYNNGEPTDVTLDYRYDMGYFCLWGVLYLDNLNECYLYFKHKTTGETTPPVRLNLQESVSVFTHSLKPELNLRGTNWSRENAEHEDYTYFRGGPADLYHTFQASGIMFSPWNAWHYTKINVSELMSGNTLVSVVNSEGEPITNATVNYVCVDNAMAVQGDAGTATYDAGVKGYQISTDPNQYAEFIEVVPEPGSGYQSAFVPMYLRDYDYTSRENKGKMRRQVIVLGTEEAQLKGLTLETPQRSGNLADNKMQAVLNADNLLMMSLDQTLNYSQTADYESATKFMNSGKFGEGGWSGTKYAHLTGSMACDESFDQDLLFLDLGSEQLMPTATGTKFISKQEFTTFSQNYCLFDFDLTDKIEADATVQPVLRNATAAVAEMPSLHNHTVDLAVLNEENKVELPNNMTELTKVDDEAKGSGVDMKDSGKAFDNFSFQLPPVLPFTVNIERNGDYFLVRGIMERNFIPGGAVMDVLDKMDNLSYFDDQYNAIMDACNTAEPVDDGFFDDIPRIPSAFCGIKGFISGIGYIDREAGKLRINFYDGGLTFEASAKASASVSFGIGSFGMSVDAKLATTMMLINRNAAQGDVVSLPKIDFVIDNQCRLKVCAWAQAGIDIWIAKAVAGVRGGACIDLQTRSIIPTYGEAHHSGTKISLQAKMEAFAEARFLFFKKKKTWPIFNYKKVLMKPNNVSNPLHPDYAEDLFTVLSKNVTKNYRKLRRKTIAELGKPIIKNVSGMAMPTYMVDGKSILFNNLKTPSNYNDDRLQLYADGSQKDIFDSGNTPMYDFSRAGNPYFEIVAYEQLGETVDGDAIDALTEKEQTKAISEKSQIKMAWRTRGNIEEDMYDWTPVSVGDVQENMAYVNPAVAVAPYNYQDYEGSRSGAVVWQQGVAKFNDTGDRYIDGSLMLLRQKFRDTSGPIEIKRLNRRNVPADYQVAMKDDSVLVMMALQQDINNQEKKASVVYVSVSPDDKVRERYTMMEGTKPQMVRVGDANLVAFLQQTENGRDIVLNTVNMKGESTGKLSGPLGMNRRMINDYKLVVESDRFTTAELSNVALIWNQSDEEQTDNGDGTTTVAYKSRIFAAKLCSNDHRLYFSAPVQIATMPDDVNLVSMDGYLSGLDLKVAYCVANDDEGAAVLETNVTFANAIDHKIAFNPYEVSDEQKVPVTITVANNGYDPISKVEVTMDGETTAHELQIMPQETAKLTIDYPVTDNFTGNIDYDVTATFTAANSNALKIGHRRARGTRPQRVQQSGTQMDVRQVDMALKVISKRTDADGNTTVVAEVNNASLLPLADGLSVKVGLYATPLATEKADGSTEVTVNASDLYDATTKQNKVKIVSLTAKQPELDQTLFLRTTPMNGKNVLTDVRPANNVLPIGLKGQFLLGDVNSDGAVTPSDAIMILYDYFNVAQTGFNRRAADVNGDSNISPADAIEALYKYFGTSKSKAPTRDLEVHEPQ